ncbi:MAG: GxxExxY protein [Bacteroidetes bacterium]|nr:GxxExxY protein [Bacteroidota bacterium]MBS1628745.1 GxxExxY protein [Bacteroidota bacterium]
MRENELSGIILDTCIRLHSQYGPGLFETVYEELLAFELAKQNLSLQRQQPIPILHEGLKIELGFKADLIIENKVLIEIKSLKALEDVHFKSVLTYLKLTGLKLGLLINFNESLLKQGYHRIVNKL